MPSKRCPSIESIREWDRTKTDFNHHRSAHISPKCVVVRGKIEKVGMREIHRGNLGQFLQISKSCTAQGTKGRTQVIRRSAMSHAIRGKSFTYIGNQRFVKSQGFPRPTSTPSLARLNVLDEYVLAIVVAARVERYRWTEADVEGDEEAAPGTPKIRAICVNLRVAASILPSPPTLLG